MLTDQRITSPDVFGSEGIRETYMSMQECCQAYQHPPDVSEASIRNFNWCQDMAHAALGRAWNAKPAAELDIRDEGAKVRAYLEEEKYSRATAYSVLSWCDRVWFQAFPHRVMSPFSPGILLRRYPRDLTRKGYVRVPPLTPFEFRLVMEAAEAEDAHPSWQIVTILGSACMLRSGSVKGIARPHVRKDKEGNLWLVQRRQVPVGTFRPKTDVTVPIPDRIKPAFLEWYQGGSDEDPKTRWFCDWLFRDRLEGHNYHVWCRDWQRPVREATFKQIGWYPLIEKALGKGARRKYHSLRSIGAEYVPAAQHVRQAIGGWRSGKIMRKHYMNLGAAPREIIEAVNKFSLDPGQFADDLGVDIA